MFAKVGASGPLWFLVHLRLGSVLVWVRFWFWTRLDYFCFCYYFDLRFESQWFLVHFDSKSLSFGRFWLSVHLKFWCILGLGPFLNGGPFNWVQLRFGSNFVRLGLIRKKKQLIIYDNPILEMSNNIVSVLSNQFQNQMKSRLLINYFIAIFVGKNLLGEQI